MFQEWCDALIACQHDRSLKTTLTPIVSKLSDMRVVNGELETMSIQCDSKNPTASGTVMKSGYGINQIVTGSISSNQSSAVTKPQNAVSYFPEFGYETYWRLLERMGTGRFEFQKNPYSTYKNRTHFSPIWMPDGSYTVNTWIFRWQLLPPRR